MLSDGRTTIMARRCRGDEGSVLMLMPAAVLIVLVLGAIAVDLSVVHLARRDLLDLASSAANDAVTAGAPPDAFRTSGTYALDQGAIDRAVRRSVLAHQRPGTPEIEWTAFPGPADQPPSVTVVVRRHVDYLFAKAIPGAHEGTEVEARATAAASQR